MCVQIHFFLCLLQAYNQILGFQTFANFLIVAKSLRTYIVFTI